MANLCGNTLTVYGKEKQAAEMATILEHLLNYRPDYTSLHDGTAWSFSFDTNWNHIFEELEMKANHLNFIYFAEEFGSSLYAEFYHFKGCSLSIYATEDDINNAKEVGEDEWVDALDDILRDKRNNFINWIKS